MGRTRYASGDTSTEGSSDDAEEGREILAGLKISSRKVVKSSFSAWHHCLGRNSTAEFAEDCEIALRAAILCVVFAAPFMMPASYFPSGQALNSKLSIAQNGVMYFLFTIWKSFGSCLDVIRQNIIGISIWVLHSWIWDGLILNDALGMQVTEPGLTPLSLLIWVEGALFIFLSLWLNFSPNVALWIVGSFVWSWMSKLQPGTEDDVRISSISNYLGVLVGGVMALVAMLLPYPIFSIWKAKDTGSEIITMLSDTWEEYVRCFHRTEDQARVNLLARDVRQARAKIAVLEGHLGDARWEVYLSSSWRGSYRMLQRTVPYLKDLCDRLLTMIDNGVEEQDYAAKTKSKEDEEYTYQMLGSIEGAIDAFVALQAACSQAILDGKITKKDAQALQEAVGRARAGRESLQNMHRQTHEKTAGGVIGAHGVNEQSLSTCIVCFEACAMIGDTVVLSEDLIGHSKGQATVPDIPGVFDGATAIFDREVLYDPRHLKWALRFLVLLVVAQVIGYLGLGVIPPYSVYIANVISVMVNQRGPGSELLKDLARIQGMIVGTVGGQFINAFLGGCSVMSQTLEFIALAAWMMAAFFMVFHSKEYTSMYFGYMLAEFGTFEMVVPCSEATYDPTAMFARVSCLLISLLLLFTVGAIIPQQRASKVAGTSITTAYHALHEAFDAIFDPSIKEASIDTGTIAAAISKAKTYGAEARKEPRSCRPPWQGEVFDQTVKAAESFSSMLTSLSRAAALESGDEGMKSEYFIQMTGLSSFKALWRIQHEQLRLLDEMVSTVFEEEQERPDASTLQSIIDFGLHTSSWEDARKMLVSEIYESTRQACKHSVSAEGEQARTVLATYRSLKEKVRDLQKAYIYN